MTEWRFGRVQIGLESLNSDKNLEIHSSILHLCHVNKLPDGPLKRPRMDAQ